MVNFVMVLLANIDVGKTDYNTDLSKWFVILRNEFYLSNFFIDRGR